MTTYTSKDHMVARFGVVEINRIAPDDERINIALADATALVDAFLGVAFTVPLKEIPTILVRVTCDIARAMLYIHHVPTFVAQGYQQALERLDDIVEGRMLLNILSPLHKGRESVALRVQARTYGRQSDSLSSRKRST